MVKNLLNQFSRNMRTGVVDGDGGIGFGAMQGDGAAVQDAYRLWASMRSGARVPRARQAPLNSSICATSARIPDVMTLSVMGIPTKIPIPTHKPQVNRDSQLLPFL